MTGDPTAGRRRRASTTAGGSATGAGGRAAVPDSYRDGYEPEPRPLALGVAFVGLGAAAWVLVGEAFVAALVGIHGRYGLVGGLAAMAVLPVAWPATVELRERVRAAVGRRLGYDPVIHRRGYVQPHVKMPGALVERRDNAVALAAPLLALDAAAACVVVAAVHPAATYLAAAAFLFNTVASANDVRGLWRSVGLPEGTLLSHPETDAPTVVVYEPERSESRASASSGSPVSAASAPEDRDASASEESESPA